MTIKFQSILDLAKNFLYIIGLHSPLPTVGSVSFVRVHDLSPDRVFAACLNELSIVEYSVIKQKNHSRLWN